jgi:hypothetical protein
MVWLHFHFACNYDGHYVIQRLYYHTIWYGYPLDSIFHFACTYKGHYIIWRLYYHNIWYGHPLDSNFHFAHNCGSCYALGGQIVWYGHPLGSIFHSICDNICLQTHNSCHSGMENGKCYLMDAHIILFVLPGHSSYHSWMWNKKWLLMVPTSYIVVI